MATKSEELVRIPALEQEHLALAHEVLFKTEHHKSEIITPNLASLIHERIASNLIFFLGYYWTMIVI